MNVNKIPKYAENINKLGSILEYLPLRGDLSDNGTAMKILNNVIKLIELDHNKGFTESFSLKFTSPLFFDMKSAFNFRLSK